MRGADTAAESRSQTDDEPTRPSGSRSTASGENSSGHGSGEHLAQLKGAASSRLSGSCTEGNGGPVWEPEVASVIEQSGWPEDVFMDPAKQVRVIACLVVSF